MTRSLGRCYRTLLSRCTKQWEVRSLSLHLRCCYGLTLCTSCILYQLATRATLDNKDIICYKEKRLVRYSLPSEWLAGIWWTTCRRSLVRPVGHGWAMRHLLEQWIKGNIDKGAQTVNQCMTSNYCLKVWENAWRCSKWKLCSWPFLHFWLHL